MCELVERCPVYNGEMRLSGSICNKYKNCYCSSNKNSCARYMIFTQIGRGYVPGNLFPDMLGKARQIIVDVKLGNLT